MPIALAADSAIFGDPTPRMRPRLDRWSIEDYSVHEDALPITVDVNPPRSTAIAQIDSFEQAALSALLRYARLPTGWDGYSAEKFSGSALANARQIVTRAAAYFRHIQIVPTDLSTGPASDGSVDVEIQLASRRLLFIVYPGANELTVYEETPGGAPEKTFPVGAVPLEDLFQGLVRAEVV
jgi:hypothetical protein